MWTSNTKPPYGWPLRGQENGPVAAWLLNDGAGAVARDSGPYGIQGSLVGLASEYGASVTGGIFSAAEFAPSGTAYGKTRYVYGSYKLSYWYMMDPEMDGAWYLWDINASDPWMDGYLATKAGTGDAWGGSYGATYSVSMGNLSPSPWRANGLCQSGSGYLSLANHNLLEPGTTGNWSIVWTATPTVDDSARYWFSKHNGGTGWALGGAGYSTSWYVIIGSGMGHYVQLNTSVPAIVAGTRMVMAATFDRSGSARLYRDGIEIGSVGITGLTQSASSGTPILVGRHYNDIESCRVPGVYEHLSYFPRVLSSSEIAAYAQAPYRDWQASDAKRFWLLNGDSTPETQEILINTINSTESFSSPTINVGTVNIIINTIESNEIINNPSIFNVSPDTIYPNTISSSENISNIEINPDSVNINLDSISSLENILSPLISLGPGADINLILETILSNEDINYPYVYQQEYKYYNNYYYHYRGKGISLEHESNWVYTYQFVFNTLYNFFRVKGSKNGVYNINGLFSEIKISSPYTYTKIIKELSISPTSILKATSTDKMNNTIVVKGRVY